MIVEEGFIPDTNSRLEKNNATEDFIIRCESEPHALRRKLILAKYPQIKSLFGPEPKTKYIVILLVALQLFVASIIHQVSIIPFLLITYLIGATVNHMLFVLIHDITHNLAFKNKIYNNMLALIANLPITIPMAIGFKEYHFAHHVYQGANKLDTDIPTRVEAELCGNKPVYKFIWLLLFPLMYAIRPLIINPKKISFWMVANTLLQIGFDGIILHAFGWSGFSYLLLSTYLSMSIHPSATHFIAEHFVVTSTQETYSYYGPLNKIIFDVGRHNEHHDFPYVPWSRLKKITTIAPEFYKNLYAHKSLIGLTLRFIFDRNITLYSRVVKR